MRIAFNELVMVPVCVIGQPENSMRSGSSDDEMTRLVESIRAVGVMQPIGVVADGDGYRCVWGRRRVLAAVECGLEEIPAVVVNVNARDEERLKFMENRVREDVNPVDEALWMAAILKRLGVNQIELAKLLQMSEGYISSRLSLLLWPEDLLKALGERRISFSVGRELVQIGDDEERSRLLHFAVENGCSARMAVEWRRGWEARQGGSGPVSRRPPAHVDEIPWERQQMLCLRCGHEIYRGAARYIEVCGECEMQVKRGDDQVGSTEISGESTSQTSTP